MRDGADHLIRIPYEEVSLATCPIRAVEPWIAVRTNAGWGMTQGYLFPHITSGADRGSVRGWLFLTAPLTVLLKQHSVAAKENQDFSMHSFRSGGGGFTSEYRWRCIKNRAERGLEELKNGMEVHEAG